MPIFVCTTAQFPYYGHNDREKINLKGKVASVAEYFCVVKEAFGEWGNGGGASSIALKDIGISAGAGICF